MIVLPHSMFRKDPQLLSQEMIEIPNMTIVQLIYIQVGIRLLDEQTMMMIFHQLEGQILRSMISVKKKPGFKEEARMYMMKTGDRMKVT